MISPTTGPKPGWTIGCHFIPFVNWIVPAFVLKETADATFRYRPVKYAGYLVAVWWTAFVLMNLTQRFNPNSVVYLAVTWLAGISVSVLIALISTRQASYRAGGLPAAPRPVMLPTGGPRPVAASRISTPRPAGAPAGRRPVVVRPEPPGGKDLSQEPAVTSPGPTGPA